jgi:hypothetical protein
MAVKTENFKTVAINILVTFALLFLLLVTPAVAVAIYHLFKKSPPGVEEGLRQVYKERQDLVAPLAEDHELTLLYKDYIVWRRGEHTGENINISNDGIRKSLGQINEKTNGGYIFLGGSTIYGYGVSDQNTIPSQFHKLTKQPVLNYGETGYVVRQSLSMLENSLITNKLPNEQLTIISYDGANDVSHRCRSEIFGLETGYQSLIQDSIKSKVSPDSYFSFKVLIKPWIELVRKLQQRSPDNVNPESFDCSSNPEKARMVAETLIRTWKQMHIIASANGHHFLAALQPLAFYGSPKLPFKMSSTDEVIAEQVRAVYPLIQKMAKNEKFNFLDLTDSLNEDLGKHYFDFCHIDSGGNGVIAKRFAEKLGGAPARFYEAGGVR